MNWKGEKMDKIEETRKKKKKKVKMKPWQQAAAGEQAHESRLAVFPVSPGNVIRVDRTSPH
jgi:hypothetical protein